MGTDTAIRPPAGFVLDEVSPTPPKGFVLDSAPPPGFVLDEALPAGFILDKPKPTMLSRTGGIINESLRKFGKTPLGQNVGEGFMNYARSGSDVMRKFMPAALANRILPPQTEMASYGPMDTIGGKIGGFAGTVAGYIPAAHVATKLLPAVAPIIPGVSPAIGPYIEALSKMGGIPGYAGGIGSAMTLGNVLGMAEKANSPEERVQHSMEEALGFGEGAAVLPPLAWLTGKAVSPFTKLLPQHEGALRSEIKASVDIPETANLNAISVREAANRVIAGDRSVLKHIQDGIKEKGVPTVEHNLENEVVDVMEQRVHEMVKQGVDPIAARLLLEKNLPEMKPLINSVLHPTETRLPAPKLSTGLSTGRMPGNALKPIVEAFKDNTAKTFKFDANSTPNEGRFSITQPQEFDAGSFVSRAKANDVKAPDGIRFIVGKIDGEDKVQAIRFDKNFWTEQKASQWWGQHQDDFVPEAKAPAAAAVQPWTGPNPRMAEGVPAGIVAPGTMGNVNTREDALNVLTGGVPRFLKEDVLPAAKNTLKTLIEAKQDIHRTIAAPTVSTMAEKASGTLRENLGVMARSWDRADAALEKTKNFFDKQKPEFNIAFIDAVEKGGKQANPIVDKMASTLRELLDKKREEVRALGTGKLENFIENYFPHMWEDPKRASNLFAQVMARRPLEGSKAFLKRRSIEFTKDGIEQGLKPVTYNPVEMTMLKIREMDKYIMAHKMINTLKDEGLVKFVRIGDAKPADFVKIDDSMSTVFSRGENGEMILRGHYYAQEDAARIINNYLSKGLQKNAIFSTYRNAGNTLNQFQLGLSAFHLGFTSMDATISRFAKGLNEVFSGHPIKGLKSMVSAPAAPVTNILKGNKLLKAWYGKPSTPLEARIADLMATAGGRAKMDKFYSNEAWKSFKKSFNEGNYPGTAVRLPFAAVDLVAKPMLEEIVPRQKLGVFFDLMKMEIENHPEMTNEQLRPMAQKIWDSVDNRMGQLVYDNLFWNKTVKDLAMASVRSVGWNLGTFRELGGAGVDTAKVLADLMHGKKTQFTYKMSYAISLPIVTGIYGAIYMYLRTGKGPETLKDYYFPQNGGVDANGNPSRDSLPTYMKDLYHYKQAPIRTLTNKLQPLNSMIAQMLMNKDYYGTEIRNADDPAMQQLMDELKFTGEQLKPFGIRNVEKSLRKDLPSKILPFVGVVPAPYDINKTLAEVKASELLGERRPVGARTKAEAEKSQLIGDLRRQYLTKDPDFRKNLIIAIKARRITSREVKDIYKSGTQTPLQRSTSKLGWAEFTKVYQKATPEEKKQLKVMYFKKRRGAIRRGEILP